MNAAPQLPPRFDLGPIVEAIARELDGGVAAERIESLLHELLEREFSDVKIATFVPIFLRRAALETLRRELPPHPGTARAIGDHRMQGPTSENRGVQPRWQTKAGATPIVKPSIRTILVTPHADRMTPNLEDTPWPPPASPTSMNPLPTSAR
jgi:hypothetical protein